MKTFYMHTIDGRPAAYFPGNGICYMGYHGKPNPLAASLKQIRQEQKASAEYRRGLRLDRGLNLVEDMTEYDHRRVCLPE